VASASKNSIPLIVYLISYPTYTPIPAYGLRTLRPSRDFAAAPLNDYIHLLVNILIFPSYALGDETYIVTLLHSTTSTESQAHPRGPCSALEEEDGEDDAKGEAETGPDE
jgi:hypothetical protein